MDIFYGNAIILVSILLILLLFNYWYRVRVRFDSSVNFDLVMFIATYKIVMYFFLPSILRINSNFSFDRLIGVEPYELLEVYLIEFLSYICWLIAIGCSLKFFHYCCKGDQNNSLKYVTNNLVNEKSSLILMVLICIFYIILFPYSSQKRMDINNGDALLIQPILMLIGPIVGIYIFSIGKNFFFRYFLAGPVIILSFFGAFTGGSRGQLMAFLLWFLFLYLFVKRNRELLVAAFFMVFVLLFAGGTMTQIRSEERLISGEFGENISVMYEGVRASKSKDALLESIEFRFGEGGRQSVGFLRLVTDGKSAGLKPIESALWSMLPRRYFPEKPLLGSIDGTREGMGMHVTHIVLEGRPNVMSEFYTGLHAYWELNFFGVMILSAISGFFISVCIIYFGRIGIFGLPLLMVVLKPPWLEPKLWISELIADTFHMIVPLLFFWYLIRMLVVFFLKNIKILKS